VQVWIIAKICN